MNSIVEAIEASIAQLPEDDRIVWLRFSAPHFEDYPHSCVFLTDEENYLTNEFQHFMNLKPL